MQSLFAQLFLLLQAHIKSQVPEIRQIDQELGQLDYYAEGTRPAVAWPCLLIDFEDANFSDHHDNVQWVDLNSIAFKLGFSPFSSAASFTPDVTKEQALKFYEIEHKLYQALQGFDAGGIIQPLTRTNAVTQKREDAYRVRIMAFSTATEDNTLQYHHLVQAAPIIEIDNTAE